jgi:hypothetical protein
VVGVYLFVEGGGSSNDLKTECRHGFSVFLEKAGLKGKMPRIVACGGREQAFDRFSTTVKQGEAALLLVDSETAIPADCRQGDTGTWKPWAHLKNRQGDNWEQPGNASDSDCHLMAQCVELIAKVQIYKLLAEATKNCETKKPYGKGGHSFKVLAHIDPAKVTAASPRADRFVNITKEKMNCIRGNK